MAQKPKILVIDDEIENIQAFRAAYFEDWEIVGITTPEELMHIKGKIRDYHITVLDLMFDTTVNLEDDNIEDFIEQGKIAGLNFLKWFTTNHSFTPIIVLSGFGQLKDYVAEHFPHIEFFTKPFDLNQESKLRIDQIVKEFDPKGQQHLLRLLKKMGSEGKSFYPEKFRAIIVDDEIENIQAFRAAYFEDWEIIGITDPDKLMTVEERVKEVNLVVLDLMFDTNVHDTLDNDLQSENGEKIAGLKFLDWFARSYPRVPIMVYSGLTDGSVIDALKMKYPKLLFCSKPLKLDESNRLALQSYSERFTGL